jgi:hypothetical protein
MKTIETPQDFDFRAPTIDQELHSSLEDLYREGLPKGRDVFRAAVMARRLHSQDIPLNTPNPKTIQPDVLKFPLLDLDELKSLASRIQPDSLNLLWKGGLTLLAVERMGYFLSALRQI